MIENEEERCKEEYDVTRRVMACHGFSRMHAFDLCGRRCYVIFCDMGILEMALMTT